MMTMMTTATQQVYSFIMLKIGNVVQSLLEVAFNFFLLFLPFPETIVRISSGVVFIQRRYRMASVYFEKQLGFIHTMLFFFQICFTQLKYNINQLSSPKSMKSCLQRFHTLLFFSPDTRLHLRYNKIKQYNKLNQFHNRLDTIHNWKILTSKLICQL